MTEKTIPLDLPADQVELALVALYVLDELHTGTPLPVDHLVAQALRFFDIRRPLDLRKIGNACDAMFDPLSESRLTPADRLRMQNIDPDSITDEEATAIIRGIEAQHGPIIPDDFERAFAS